MIRHDYEAHNHLETTIPDAAQHMAGKKFFCKLDCFQAYHCIQMANEQSLEFFPFNLGSRTFAYQRLAPG